jgi:hypothetical protein
LDRCEVSVTIPFDPAHLWSGSIISSKPDTGIEIMVHIALTSMCEDRLVATATLLIALLLIQNQENPVWQQRLEAMSDLEGPHFHAFLFDQLAGVQVFSKIDFHSGYHQIKTRA